MIAIKGMEEMPKCCYECPYFDDYCALTSKWERDTEQIRDNDCPLVEIVTCKDCKHWQRIKDYHGRCKLFDEVWRGNSLVPIEHGTNEEFYCQMAERRE